MTILPPLPPFGGGPEDFGGEDAPHAPSVETLRARIAEDAMRIARAGLPVYVDDETPPPGALVRVRECVVGLAYYTRVAGTARDGYGGFLLACFEGGVNERYHFVTLPDPNSHYEGGERGTFDALDEVINPRTPKPILPPLPALSPAVLLSRSEAPSVPDDEIGEHIEKNPNGCGIVGCADCRWRGAPHYPEVTEPASVLAVDWPWQFNDKLGARGAEANYRTMAAALGSSFPLPPLADNCVLLFWRVAAMQQEALAMIAAWGFTLKSELVWIKTMPCKACGGRGWSTLKEIALASAPVRAAGIALGCAHADVRVWCEACIGRGYKIAIGMGRYVRGAHETCLIAVRGKRTPVDKGTRSVFFAPRLEHSEKPDRFYEIVEKLYPTGPRVELFARKRRPGWIAFGDELPPVNGETQCGAEGAFTP